jgi:hypothetical protein
MKTNINENKNVNVNINENRNENISINKIRKTSFCYGVLGGIITSVIASAIWYFIQSIIEK